MSMLKTLAKVAIGIAVAKGVSGMMNKGNANTGNPAGSGNGGLLDGLADNTTAHGGGLGDLLGQVLGGNAGNPGAGGTGGLGGLGGLLEQLGGAGGASGGQTAGSGGGLGGLLEQLAGAGGAKGGAGGGIGDLLGGLAGAASGSGGLGDLLGGLAGNAPQQRNSGGTFGELLNGALQNGGEPEVQPSVSEEAVAALMLRAMIQATKADGQLDADEKKRLMENLKDGSKQEIDFVNRELAAPMDIDGLVAQVPQGLEQQVYAMSVMGINLDQQSEAQYLDQLARAMNVDQSTVNQIHDQLGVQRLYG